MEKAISDYQKRLGCGYTTKELQSRTDQTLKAPIASRKELIEIRDEYFQAYQKKCKETTLVLGDLRDLKQVTSLHDENPVAAGFKKLDILNWEFRKRNIGQRETYKFGERKISVDIDYDKNLNVKRGVARIIYNEKSNPLQDVANRYINAEGILRHLTIVSRRNSYLNGLFLDKETGSANGILYLSKGRRFLPHKFTLMELQLLRDMGWKLQEKSWKD
ncbi:MAG: hypothetical protein O3C23_03125, partial [bacterium]|nr:hypothetical protein [bacterium]